MTSIILLFSFLFISAPIDNHTLTVHVTNIEAVQGILEIGVYNKSDGFLEKGRAMKTIKISVKAKSETIVIGDLPQGTYAVSMYHDKNSDGECNLNFMGIPKEPYAFSNNIRPKFSAPKFEDCKFELNSDQALNIILK